MKFAPCMRQQAARKKILLFDLGGVLMRISHFEALRELTSFRGSDEALRELWLRSQAVKLFDGGKISPEAFGEQAVEELGINLSPQAFLIEFRDWLHGFHDGAEALVAELRQWHRVGCLSNSNALHWSSRIERVFDFAYSSHRIGHVKPEPAAFAHVVRIEGVAAADIVFFDDSILNVEAAKAFGMCAYHTVGFSSLVGTLETIGLLPVVKSS